MPNAQARFRMMRLMSFRDGNDPSKVPGAVVVYPAVNDNFVFDENRKIVINKPTGECLTFQITDREERSFHVTITNTDGGPFIAAGYVGKAKRQDFGTTRAYNITAVVRYTEEGPVHVDYPMETLAEFLNAYPDHFGKYEYTGHVVVVDNRKIWKDA